MTGSPQASGNLASPDTADPTDRTEPRALLDAVAGASATGMIVVDAAGDVVWSNPAAGRLLGLELRAGEAIGLPSGGEATYVDVPNGRVLRIEASTGRFAGDDVLLYLLNDVTEDRAEIAELATEASTDATTNVLNRRGFLHSAATFDQTAPVSVLFVDLAGFKAVNDACGHDVGDAVLRAVAGRLHHLIRSSDLVARWGGDEFVLMTPNADAAEHLAGRIVDALSEPTQAGGHRLVVGASVGWATSTGGWDLDELVAEADRHMYEHKQGRRRDPETPTAPASGAVVGSDVSGTDRRNGRGRRRGDEAVVDVRETETTTVEVP